MIAVFQLHDFPRRRIGRKTRFSHGIPMSHEGRKSGVFSHSCLFSLERKRTNSIFFSRQKIIGRNARTYPTLALTYMRTVSTDGMAFRNGRLITAL
jgi:hypothetical protein